MGYLNRSNFAKFIALVGLLTIALLYQNCGPDSAANQLRTKAQETEVERTPESAETANNTDSPKGDSNLSMVDGGQGYDGKVYVKRLNGGVCADGSEIESVIAFRNDAPILTRSDCSNIPITDQLQVIVFAVPNDVNSIIFNGDIYIAISPNAFTWKTGLRIIPSQAGTCINTQGPVFTTPIVGSFCDPFETPGDLRIGESVSRGVFDFSQTSFFMDGDLNCGVGGVIQGYSCNGN